MISLRRIKNAIEKEHNLALVTMSSLYWVLNINTGEIPFAGGIVFLRKWAKKTLKVKEKYKRR